ncbi:MAG: O-methyltransferase [Anaerovoracaceae bacterium]|jgi:predicted O-methyltransferase YrrM|nr:O-methyltransferase [Clostridiales bacterium]
MSNIINDKITSYLHSLYKPLNDGLQRLRQEAEEKHIPIILKETESYIYNIVKIKKPQRILEIGTAIGYASIFLATALPEADIITLEVNDNMYRKAVDNVERFGLSDRIQIRLGDAARSLIDLANEIKDVELEGFDLVFIDAAKSYYKEFWEGSVPLCRKGAIILSDNVLLKARTVSDEYITDRRQKTNVRRMRQYIDYVMSLKNADTAILTIGDGIAVSILND